MKKEFLSEELKRMKQLAGLIRESEELQEVFKNVNGKITIQLSPDLETNYQLTNHKDLLKMAFDKLEGASLQRVAVQKNNPPMWFFTKEFAGEELSLGFHLDDVEGDAQRAIWSIFTPNDSKGHSSMIGNMEVENNRIGTITLQDNNIIEFLKNIIAPTT